MGIRKPNLTFQERQWVIDIIMTNSEKRKLRRGIISMVANQMNCSKQTISTIWKIAKLQVSRGEVINITHKMGGRVGRKRVQIDLNQIKNIPLNKRSNIRSLAKHLNLAKSIVHRMIKVRQIKVHSNAIKPLLSDENMRKSLEFCLSKLHHVEHDLGKLEFEGFYNVVHIDEKWFYITKTNHKFYLHPTEEEPIRTCKSKRYITKIMFLAAVTRPIFDENGSLLFDGKLGIFPFAHVVSAKKSSKKRVSGSMETKAILSVTKEVMREALITKVISVIKSKWPEGASKHIYIQQDNARQHINITNQEFMKVATEGEWDIQMTCQPPNSSDLNVLDLGLFRAIQALQHERKANNVKEQIENVEETFLKLEARTLNNVWLTLQYCMLEVIKVQGNNTYKIPHVGKARMLREGVEPTYVSVCVDELRGTYEHIQETEDGNDEVA